MRSNERTTVIIGLMMIGVMSVSAAGQAAEEKTTKAATPPKAATTAPAATTKPAVPPAAAVTAPPAEVDTSGVVPPPKMVMLTPGTTPEAAVRQTVNNYVAYYVASEGALKITDHAVRKTRPLKLERLQEQVGKGPNDSYRIAADMIDTATNEKVVIDFEITRVKSVMWKHDGLAVAATRVQAVNGKPRYKYDAQGNRTPL